MELTVAVLVTIVVLPMIFIKVRDLFTRGGVVVDARDGKSASCLPSIST